MMDDGFKGKLAISYDTLPGTIAIGEAKVTEKCAKSSHKSCADATMSEFNFRIGYISDVYV